MKKALLMALLFSSSVFALPSKQKMIQDVDYLASLITYNYGPQNWKKQHFNWSLQKEVSTIKSEILSSNSTNLKDYQKIISKLFQSTRDYHVGHGFHSTEAATLPFSVKTVQGNVVLVHVDRTLLNEKDFPFSPGDILVEWNGKPLAHEYNKLISSEYVNVLDTDLAYADLLLTRRIGARGMDVPQGKVQIKVLTKSKNLEEVELEWSYQVEVAGDIPEHELFSFGPQQTSLHEIIKKKMMLNPSLLEVNYVTPKASENNFMLGQKNSVLPALGVKSWEAPVGFFFEAYIFELDGKNVGYLRIPSYTPPNSFMAVAQLESILTTFQEKTDSLFIEQMNNPGGSVFYLYTIVSMLTDRNLKTPHHRMILNQETAIEANATVNNLKKVTTNEEAISAIGSPHIEGYPVDLAFAQRTLKYSEFLLSEWKKGKVLSDPFYIYGVDDIEPSQRVQYTKPITVLVNELDFSGGDFFPAILQDNKRARIIGTRTSGAGGYVHGMSVPNVFGISYFSLTGSLAERVDSNPIENLGVRPDVEINITVQDLQMNFAPFIYKIKQEISKTLK